MTSINLLPWRKWEQRRRRQHFLLLLVLAFIIGIAIVYWGSLMAGSAVSSQEARNRYLRRQVAQLNHKINAIKHLKKSRKSLTHRMHIIEDLQQSRPLEVHLFEQLASTVPSSVYLTSVVYTTNSKRGVGKAVGTLKIRGVADSPAGVSRYMRSMGASRWLTVPQLEVVRTRSKNGAQQSDFSVNTRLVAPDTDGDKHGSKGKAGS